MEQQRIRSGRERVLPRLTVLERLVASIQDRAANYLWQKLASIPTVTQRFIR